MSFWYGRKFTVSGSPRSTFNRLGILTLLMLTLATAGCGDKKTTDPGEGDIQHPQDFHPTSASSWTATMSVETGTTLADLSAGLVNGGAEVYTNHHMTEYGVCAYTYNGSGTLSGGTMNLWIFKMSTHDNAVALYNDPEIIPTSGIEDLTTLGDLGRQAKALFNTTIQFVRNEFYIKVTFDRVSTEADLELELLTSGIDQEIEG
jgi:hypothetical protein